MKWRPLCAITWALLSLASAVFGQVEGEPQRFEIRLVGPNDTQGAALRSAVMDDLRRTPLPIDLSALPSHAFEADTEMGSLLALLALEFDPALTRPIVEIARVDDMVSPGWLVHAVLRAGATAGVGADVVDPRSSWLGQLVSRSTRNVEGTPADRALAKGIPALTLVLPSGDEPAIKLLAATVRRLGGLEGYPLFEDEFLVVEERVLLRRDLYWVGLALWLALYWRGRKLAGRELRWLLLAAWLVAPVYAGILLALPALVATWRPTARWPAVLALVPALAFAVLLAVAVAGPAALRLSGLPALLVVLALAAFVWLHLVGPRRAEPVVTEAVPPPATRS